MIVWLLIVILISLCLLFPKNKVIYGMMLAFAFIVIAFNTENGDTEAYQFLYHNYNNYAQHSNLGHIELSFLALVHVFSSAFKAPFQVFWIFLSAITMSGIAHFIEKYSKYPAMMMGLYFISPFFPCDINQIRNFIAEVIVIHAIYSFLQSEQIGRRAVLEYTLKILIASTFHVLSLSYLLVILVYYIRKFSKLTVACSQSSEFFKSKKKPKSATIRL